MEEIHSDVRVTALGGLDSEGDGSELLLAAVGGRLELFSGDQDDLRRRDALRIFKGASIHGILPPGKCCSSKCQEIVVFGGKSVAVVEVNCDEKRIVEVSWQRTVDDWIVACLRRTENILAVLTAHNKVLTIPLSTSLSVQVETTTCQEKCILYSGLLLELPTEASESACAVLAGTVFREIVIWQTGKDAAEEDRPVLHRLTGHEGVIFSVDFCKEKKLICSTSDDRTARLWKVDFGPEGKMDFSQATVIPSHVLRGHKVRVFRSLFTSSGGRLVTGSEDGVIAVWNPDTGDKEEEKQAHTSVWTLAVNGKRGKAKIFCGGEQGLIRSFSLAASGDGGTTEQPVKQFWTQDNPPRLTRTHKDSGSLLCLTLNGSVFKVTPDGEAELCFQDNSLDKYALMEATGDDIVFGSLVGEVVLYRFGERTAKKRHSVYEGKVFALHLLGHESDSVCLTCGPSGLLKVINYQTGNVLCSMVLEKTGDQRWPSCALLLPLGKLLVGDRSGFLHCYNSATGELLSSLKAHGSHGVGAIRSEDGGDLVMTAGRDGMQNVFDIDGDGELRRLSRVRLPVPWVEEFLPFRGDTLLLGFRSANFVTYSCGERREVLEAECGGGHRSWDFALLNESQARFSFIKDQKLFTTFLPLSELIRSEVRSGAHSKTINAVEHFSLGPSDYVATGGEDGTVQIREILTGGDSSWRIVEVLKSHISSVKSISMSKGRKGEVIMVTAGGRAEMKLWRLQSRKKCKGLIVSELSTHRLKGTDKRRKKVWRDHEIVHDTEVRYTDVEIIPDQKEGSKVVIFAGCSDGILRVFGADPDSGDIQLVAESACINHCFLRVCSDVNDGDVLTSSTDGFLRAWRLSPEEELSMLWELRSNGSGINSVAGVPLSRQRGSVVLAGDDGGNVCLVEATNSAKKLSSKACHAAQVTGLIVGRGKEGSVISCSVDQRVALWNIDSEEESRVPFLEMASQLAVDVADIQAMCSWIGKTGETNVIVVGEGMCLLRLSPQKALKL